MAISCVVMPLLSAHAATVVWGGGDALWSASNWIVDGVVGQSMPDQLTNNDDITITGGTVTYVPGGDIGYDWGSTNLTILSDGGLTQTATNWWRFNGTGTLTVEGTVTTNASNIEFGLNATDGANLVIDGGTFNHTGSGELKIRTGNTGEITGGGTLNTRFLSLGDFGDGAGGIVTTLDVSDGTLNLTDGSVAHNGIFVSGSNPGGGVVVSPGGVFNAGNLSDTDAYGSKVTDGSSPLTLYDDGSGGVTSVPESSVPLLFTGLLLSASLVRRRAA